MSISGFRGRNGGIVQSGFILRGVISRACALIAAIALMTVGAAQARQAAAGQPSRAAPSVERLATFPSLTGTAPSSPRWSPDGSQVAFLWNDGGWPFRDVWVAGADGENLRRLTDLAGKAPERKVAFGRPRPDVVTLSELKREEDARSRGGVSDLVWAPDGRRIFFVHDGELRSINRAGRRSRTLVESGGAKSQLAISPEGRWLSFLQDGDLWLWDIAEEELVRATQLGAPGIGVVPIGRFFGPDAEIIEYAWSPDGARVVFSHVDRKEERRAPFPSYLHEEPILHEVRRYAPGDPGPVRRAGVYTLENNDVRFFSLPEPKQRTVLDVAWAPDGDRILIHQDADIGEHRWIYVARAGDMSSREVYHDHRPRRIYSMFEAVWSADGDDIYFIGDADRYYRIYAIPSQGGEPRALTADAYDVTGSLSVSGETGDMFYVSTEHSPYERHLYRLSPDGGTPVRVTAMPGVHEPFYAADKTRVALISSNDETPPELYVDRLDGAASEQRITRSPLAEFYDYEWAKPRYASFDSRIDDFTLHARIIEPPNMDPGKTYPVIIGNIYSNTVRNAWVTHRPIGLLQQHQVLEKNYIVVQTDLRGSVGYGVDFRESFQGDWGGGDLEDLHSTVDYLKTLPYVDPERIGLWGNSYGGMMVLFALFERPGMFAAGVSGAPAIDPYSFTGGDQHLSRTPETHPHIFEESSLLLSGEKLEDPLLFLHSKHDDVVPYRTSLLMMEKLMYLGKDFEMAIVSDTGHWWAGRERYAVHTLRRLQRFLDDHVGPGGRPKE